MTETSPNGSELKFSWDTLDGESTPQMIDGRHQCLHLRRCWAIQADCLTGTPIGHVSLHSRSNGDPVAKRHNTSDATENRQTPVITGSECEVVLRSRLLSRPRHGLHCEDSLLTSPNLTTMVLARVRTRA
jgi:hypothetical protein